MHKPNPKIKTKTKITSANSFIINNNHNHNNNINDNNNNKFKDHMRQQRCQDHSFCIIIMPGSYQKIGKKRYLSNK